MALVCRSPFSSNEIKIICGRKTETKKERNKIMSTPITDRDLTRQAPHSPRDRIGGFAIASRTVDKCRDSLAGALGEYHYDCPLDNLLFSFKGINGEQFKAAVQAAKTYEEIGDWLIANGTQRTPAEIKAWSDKVEAQSMLNEPAKRAFFIENCAKFGLNPVTSTTFDWLEADDDASSTAGSGCAALPQ
jgi:hypothetical protein